MAGRKLVSGIRSGRFKYPSGTAGAFIVPKVKSSALHRIYNGGENVFNVELCLANGNSAAQPAIYPVGKNCSIDLQVSGNKTLKINKPNNQLDVEGVYESLDAQKDVRSGRFKVDAAAAVTPTKLIIGVSGSTAKIYRILNSGINTFTVTGTGAANIPVPQFCSVDVFVDSPNNPPVDVSVASVAANQAIQGVYDPLAADAVVRSGRFKTNANLTIIDFSAANGQKTHSYRIYNSGATNPFTVALVAGDVLGVVAPNNSIDIEVNSNNQVIEIRAANTVEGSYEFLG